MKGMNVIPAKAGIHCHKHIIPFLEEGNFFDFALNDYETLSSDNKK
ncbi:MAG: hypothetical protein M1419_09165 [Bacteroidetes bacterium]|nr:hypothetical protein [Bacteroidota bacterium]